MSDTQNTTEHAVDVLKDNLRIMPRNMCLFSLSIRSLYANKAVGTSTDVSKRFRKLRDDTRQDAILYLKCHLPISTKFVSSIKEYFEYYDALDYEEWCELLPDIREETRIYKEVAQTLLEMHEVLMTSLKKREDDAKIIMTEFEVLQSAFEKQKKILEASAESRMIWAFTLFFVPGVNLIATPLLTSIAREDTVKAIAKGGQAKVHEAAVIVVAETLIPALSNFIDGLKKTAGFFEAMEKELQSFEGKAETNIDSPKRLHYKVMRKKAKEMKSLCQAFYAALPDVRTDFAAIPNKGTDQNYVDKWLKKELAQIEKKRSTVQRYLLAVFKGSEAGGEAKGDEKSKDGEKAEVKKKYEDKESSEAEAGEKADGDEKSKDGEKDEDEGKLKLKQTNDTFYLGSFLRYFRCTLV
jgi:hypothetical protein